MSNIVRIMPRIQVPHEVRKNLRAQAASKVNVPGADRMLVCYGQATKGATGEDLNFGETRKVQLEVCRTW